MLLRRKSDNREGKSRARASSQRKMDSEENLIWRLTTNTPYAAGVTVLVLIIMFFCKYRLKTMKRWRNTELPPGPPPWPIIGNLHMLGELPHRALKDLADKYGPIMLLRLGSIPTLVVSAPDMAKNFLKTHDLVFANRPETATGKYIAYNSKDVAFAPYGDYWRKMRKTFVLELLTAKRIESFQSGRDEEVSQMIGSIWKESESGAKPVNVSKALLSFMTNIICRMLMGRNCSMDVPVNLAASINELGKMLRGLAPLTGAFDIGDFIPCVAWLDLQGIRGRMKKMHRGFDSLSEEIIDEHVANGQEHNQRGTNFVEVLLDISERAADATDRKLSSRNDIKALIMDILVAGIDTSAVTLEWAMSETLKSAPVMKRVQEELESVVGKYGRSVKPSDLPSLEYLQCVVKETMRLHPSVPLLLPHESMETCSVAGYSIPAKTRLIVNAWAIGRDPAAWGDDALDFKPERFMQPGGKNRNIDVRGQDFELIPFGSGRRGCPGMALALEVVGLALSNLLHCFDWSLESKDGVQEELNMSESFGLTMPRRFELFAVPTRRLQGPPN